MATSVQLDFTANPSEERALPSLAAPVRRYAIQAPCERIGVIRNPRSLRNAGRDFAASADAAMLQAVPSTHAELGAALASFEAERIGVLVVDGGDGTVRDVLTAMKAVWRRQAPRLLVLPSGKTNALCADLGVPRGLTVDCVRRFADAAGTRFRSPIEITGGGLGTETLVGFLLGAGAFVEATRLAQQAHRAGAFGGLAVALTLARSVGSTLWGAGGSAWRAGTGMTIAFGADAVPLSGRVPIETRDRYLLLASTLERLPLGVRPFGRERAGLKALLIDAPPRAVASSAARLLRGSETPILAARGYHRVDASAIDVDLPQGFVLDGEHFPGGRYALRRGRPIGFLT